MFNGYGLYTFEVRTLLNSPILALAAVTFLHATMYILSVYMLSQFRPSVRLSVTRVDQSKMDEVRIMQFSPYSSPIPLVFAE